MDMEIIALPAKEKSYTYSQSQQISMQTGLIGHLRADFDTNGRSFFSTWFDYRRELKSQEFKDEFDEVINGLRDDPKYGDVLTDRFHMEAFCRKHPEAAMEGNYTTEYGFRVNTAEHAYLFRLNPSRGDYNMYCYCYKRDWLDRHLRNAEKGIRFIRSNYKDRFRLADGDKVRIVHPGGDAHDYTARYIDDYHVQLDGDHGSNLYHICELAEMLERNNTQDIIPLRASLPDKCYSTLLDTGEVIILKKGESGYYKTDIPFTSRDEARRIVDEMNGKLGVNRAQEEAMKTGSMFHFSVPGADPSGYDEKTGGPKNHRRDRGDAR